MQYVSRLACVELDQRRQALTQILREEELPFVHTHAKIGSHWVENIIVRLNPSDQRLVVGAHYDNVTGSTGAEDNASGVSLLIRLAKQFFCTGASVDFVFFDREEYADQGSCQYIQAVGKENISAMINLDQCGVGSQIAVCVKGAERSPALGMLVDPNLVAKHNVQALQYLPNGDDVSFEKAGIANASVCILPEGDAGQLEAIQRDYMSKGIQPEPEVAQRLLGEIQIMQYFHNAPKDDIRYVSQQSLDQLYAYLQEALGQILN